MVLTLSRVYLPEGTNGKLELGLTLICSTIELPWRNNHLRISCIPEGIYTLRKRHSDRFNWHIEVVGVKERTHILFHPANNALKELKGCIAPVTVLTGAGCGLKSRSAFLKLTSLVFRALDLEEDVVLIIGLQTPVKE